METGENEETQGNSFSLEYCATGETDAAETSGAVEKVVATQDYNFKRLTAKACGPDARQ